MPVTKRLEPTTEEWNRLYEAAGVFRAQAAWEPLADIELVAVQFPGSEETAYCSVMGMGGQEFGVLAYLGIPGFLGYTIMVSDGADQDEMMLMMDCLAFSLEGRENLEASDRKVISGLGLSFRGAGVWPLFRRHRPNFIPAALNRGDAERLAICVEQVSALAEEGRAGRIPPDEPERILARRRDNSGVWQTGTVPEPPLLLDTKFDIRRIDAIRQQLEAAPARWEVQLIAFAPVQGERGEPDSWNRLLLCVDAKSGIILSPNILDPEDRLQDAFLGAIEAAGYYPREMRVTSPLLDQQLAPITSSLGIEVKQVANLPKLKRARTELMRQFGGGR